MKQLDFLSKKIQHACAHACMKISCFSKSFCHLVSLLYRFLLFQVNLFWIQLCYFISLSILGFLVLRALEPKYRTGRPWDLDLFFMSASAATVSSMATVEMEVFSNAQLLILTLLMLVGGEVLTSIFDLQFMKARFNGKTTTMVGKIESCDPYTDPSNTSNTDPESELPISERLVTNYYNIHTPPSEITKYKSLTYLGYLVLTYFFIIHAVGCISIALYLIFVPSASDVLRNKNIPIPIFSIFTTVSSFANVGFIPTNENMMVFRENSGLLLMIIPIVLAGNTLFPSCLRIAIWTRKKLSRSREADYILENQRSIGYNHLLSGSHSVLLALTVFGFVLVQFFLFCCMEWNSEVLDGLNTYQKIVGVLFQSVNSRHAGESVVNLSAISPAILVLYVVMMYLPPYTAFLPIKDNDDSSKIHNQENEGRNFLKVLMLSQLSYLVIFVILICITEQQKFSEDPLNFNVFNIVFEVISAYGNVGFSMGYSCQRLLKTNSHCKDAWYGFAGRWSNKGKTILIIVMFFGRLKKFNLEGGTAWKLS
ncbi:putative cation transporter HKT6 [Acorus calamus]|uniref:Cation transporter HKT6 n=1 Tax=Acorus calamus TaxID=4465 RepID=A0AAV9ESL5_ACOCL|nr:putative cation transporter HKT6 [Acorus calamus]